MTKSFKPIKTQTRQKFLENMKRKWEQKNKQRAWLDELESQGDIDLPKALRGLMY